jgi:hypothetical protein
MKVLFVGDIVGKIGRNALKGLLPNTQEFMRAEPDTFVPASGAWGRQGCTMVHLSAVDEETLGEAMTLAWQLAVGTVKGKRQKLKGKSKSKRKVKTNKPARTGTKRR